MVFRLLAVLMVVAVGGGALALVPWLRRTLFPIYLQEPGHELSGHRYLYDAQLGWRNIPGWEATTMGKPLTINSRGLRDRDHSLTKPANTKRILVLGDSFTWGYGVGDSEIFTEVLERDLAKRSQTWEVINTGVSGWGTDQEYLFLMSEGFNYSPDIVVLAYYCMNDVVDNSSARQYTLSKPVFLSTKLDLANVPVPQPGEEPEPVEPRDSAINVTQAIVRRMADECKARNAKFVLMKFGLFINPGHAQITSEVEQIAQTAAKHSDIVYFDWDAAFNRQPLSVMDVLKGNHDNHWNAVGHELTGRMLGKFLQDQGLLD